MSGPQITKFGSNNLIGTNCRYIGLELGIKLSLTYHPRGHYCTES